MVPSKNFFFGLPLLGTPFAVSERDLLLGSVIWLFIIFLEFDTQFIEDMIMVWAIYLIQEQLF